MREARSQRGANGFMTLAVHGTRRTHLKCFRSCVLAQQRMSGAFGPAEEAKMEKPSALVNDQQATSTVNLQSVGSISTPPKAEKLEGERRSEVRKVLFSRWTFVLLRVLDLLTTLIAFRLGAMEVNPWSRI